MAGPYTFWTRETRSSSGLITTSALASAALMLLTFLGVNAILKQDLAGATIGWLSATATKQASLEELVKYEANRSLKNVVSMRTSFASMLVTTNFRFASLNPKVVMSLPQFCSLSTTVPFVYLTFCSAKVGTGRVSAVPTSTV